MPEIFADDKPCDLCGLPVKFAGFELKTAEGQKTFCCLGCKAIYTLYQGVEETVRPSIISEDSQQK